MAGHHHFRIVTDYKPLQNIFTQSLNMIESRRIQNYWSRLSVYNFSVEWEKGKDHEVPDALSRSPVTKPEDEDLNAETFTPQIIANICLYKLDLTPD